MRRIKNMLRFRCSDHMWIREELPIKLRASALLSLHSQVDMNAVPTSGQKQLIYCLFYLRTLTYGQHRNYSFYFVSMHNMGVWVP